MRVNLKKRVFCYILDFFIITTLGFLLSMIIPKSTEYIFAQNDISALSESYLNNEISFSQYFNDYSILAKKIDQNNLLYVSIYFIFILVYFIIIPLYLKGRTIGMLLLKLSVIDKSNNLFKTVLIRGIVAYGVLYYLFGLIILFIPGNLYFIMLTILAIIQILVVICSIFMIKYRDDKRSLADILSNSNILIES